MVLLSCHIARDLESGIWNLGSWKLTAKKVWKPRFMGSAVCCILGGGGSRLPCHMEALPPYETVLPLGTRLADCQRGFG